MDPVSTAIVAAVVSGIVSSLATIAAIRVELRWLRHDVNRLNDTVFPTLKRRKSDHEISSQH